MRARTLTALGAALLLGGSLGCDLSTDPPKPPPIEIEIATDKSAVSPGQTLAASLLAIPRDGRILSYAILTLSGVYTAKDSVGSTGTGSLSINRNYDIPPTTPTGSLVVRGVAVATDGSKVQVSLTLNVASQ